MKCTWLDCLQSENKNETKKLDKYRLMSLSLLYPQGIHKHICEPCMIRHIILKVGKLLSFVELNIHLILLQTSFISILNPTEQEFNIVLISFILFR